MSEPWVVALLAATAAHAGFQATVTLLVYPALARVAAADFASAHEQPRPWWWPGVGERQR